MSSSVIERSSTGGLKSLSGFSSGHPLDVLCDSDSMDASSRKSIRDHYGAFMGSEDKKINNFSNINLGDDRVYYTKTITALSYDSEVNVADSDPFDSLWNEADRRIAYDEALASCVGPMSLSNIIKLIKLKLNQRSRKYGAYQLHKNFKFYDKARSGFVGLREFKLSLELLGFQFNKAQYIALFASFDEECQGTICYSDFMKVVSNEFTIPEGKTEESHHTFAYDRESKGLSDEEVLKMKRDALKRVFSKFDPDLKDQIRSSSLRQLLFELRTDPVPPSAFDVNGIIRELGTNAESTIDYDVFFTWWINSPK